MSPRPLPVVGDTVGVTFEWIVAVLSLTDPRGPRDRYECTVRVPLHPDPQARLTSGRISAWTAEHVTEQQLSQEDLTVRIADGLGGRATTIGARDGIRCVCTADPGRPET